MLINTQDVFADVKLKDFFSKIEFENLLELEKYDSVLKLTETQQFKLELVKTEDKIFTIFNTSIERKF